MPFSTRDTDNEIVLSPIASTADHLSTSIKEILTYKIFILEAQWRRQKERASTNVKSGQERKTYTDVNVIGYTAKWQGVSMNYIPKVRAFYTQQDLLKNILMTGKHPD